MLNIEVEEPEEELLGDTIQSKQNFSGSDDWSNLYEQLGATPLSSSGEIHRFFFRDLRKLLRLANREGSIQSQAKKIQTLWIVHDILTDTVSRNDFDLRALRLGDSPAEMLERQQSSKFDDLHDKIGELLLCAGLLEATELGVACDMHKAVPEMQFGNFLVKHGFIQERDLESALIGQQLIRSGIITFIQYQMSMELAVSRQVSISEVLIEKDFVSQSVIDGVVIPQNTIKSS